MSLDTSDYYPYTPGSGCDPEEEKGNIKSAGSSENNMGGEISLHSVDDEKWNVMSNRTAEEKSHSSEDKNMNREISKLLEVMTEEDERPPRGFMTGFSHAMSWIFSPVIVPTYAIIMVFYFSMLSYAPTSSKISIIAIVFAFTAFIPALAVWVLTRYGDVSDMALSRRTDRLIPYIVEGASLMACGYYLTTTGLPDWVGFFFIGAAVATGINLVINFRWKISAHGAGMGGFIAMILVMNRYGLPQYNLWGWCLAAVVIAGVLGMSRVWLGRHTPLQTVAGEIVGFLGVLSMELFIPSPYVN